MRQLVMVAQASPLLGWCCPGIGWRRGWGVIWVAGSPIPCCTCPMFGATKLVDMGPIWGCVHTVATCEIWPTKLWKALGEGRIDNFKKGLIWFANRIRRNSDHGASGWGSESATRCLHPQKHQSFSLFVFFTIPISKFQAILLAKLIYRYV